MFVNDESVSSLYHVSCFKSDNLNFSKEKKGTDRSFQIHQGWLRDQVSLPFETEWTIAFHQNHEISVCNEREVKCVML